MKSIQKSSRIKNKSFCNPLICTTISMTEIISLWVIKFLSSQSIAINIWPMQEQYKLWWYTRITYLRYFFSSLLYINHFVYINKQFSMGSFLDWEGHHWDIRSSCSSRHRSLFPPSVIDWLINWQLIVGWGTDSSNTKVSDFTTITCTVTASYSHLNYPLLNFGNGIFLM